MTTPTKAEALEALKRLQRQLKYGESVEYLRQQSEDVQAIRAALSAGEVEPVAWQYRYEPDLAWHTVGFEDEIPKGWPELQSRPLFATPPQGDA